MEMEIETEMEMKIIEIEMGTKIKIKRISKKSSRGSNNIMCVLILTFLFV